MYPQTNEQTIAAAVIRTARFLQAVGSDQPAQLFLSRTVDVILSTFGEILDAYYLDEDNPDYSNIANLITIANGLTFPAFELLKIVLATPTIHFTCGGAIDIQDGNLRNNIAHVEIEVFARVLYHFANDKSLFESSEEDEPALRFFNEEVAPYIETMEENEVEFYHPTDGPTAPAA
jgi:hypothetical protein